MTFRLLATALAVLAAPLAASVAAQPDVTATPQPDIQQQAALRCAAAIAVASTMQAQGTLPEGAEYPPLAERGREFFVRSTAKVMEETGMTREQVAAALRAQATDLSDPAALEAVMPACLLLLDASGI